jgi:hypothetical protein
MRVASSPAAGPPAAGPAAPAADGALDVPDPIRGGAANYERVLHLIEAAVPGLMTTIREHLKT